MVNKIIVGLSIVALIIIVVVFLYPILSNLTVKHYSFNEEIRGFPIEKTSVTFTGWRIVNASWGLTNDIVIVNYTVRNIGDTTLDTSDFLSAKTPILKYGNSYYADSTIYILTGWGFYQSASFPYSMYPTQLMPNQALTNGFLEFKIIQGTQPTELIFPDKDSPSIIIDFS